jgi:protein-S-isoprenylcysteine O-methyltransferase Ste14
MNDPVLLLILLNFAAIGALPRMFFRDGRLGPMWWATALPFFVCPVFLLLARLSGFEPLTPPGWAPVLALAAVPVAVASVALICLTVGTHRTPLALWHQDDDAPGHLVTHGPYSRIRHPFYTAFILAFTAALVFFPHPVTLLALIYGAGMLNHTAAREEGRLRASEFGSEYRRYGTRTGRFLPRPPWGGGLRSGA